MSNYKRFGLANLRDVGRGKSGPSQYYQVMENGAARIADREKYFYGGRSPPPNRVYGRT